MQYVVIAVNFCNKIYVNNTLQTNPFYDRIYVILIGE